MADHAVGAGDSPGVDGQDLQHFPFFAVANVIILHIEILLVQAVADVLADPVLD